jgi:tRNA-splicing ligase RtcB
MADGHQGFGVPIGSVVATKGVIIPAAVGVDIGCGMLALKTKLNLEQVPPEKLKATMGRIWESVPVGNGPGGSHAERVSERDMPFSLAAIEESAPVVHGDFHKARMQLGTLGGGNHFIEIQRDAEGAVWIMIHSGSRHLGKQVGDHYNKWAKELNALWHDALGGKFDVPPSWQLPYLRLDTKPGQQYMAEMTACIAYALANRKRMLDRIIEAFEAEFFPYCCVGEVINIAHNYAAKETHFGEEVIVHRKGATLATEGLTGIIPGSQGTKSYIVRGKGNPESFNSCSHGAGRRMGRREATRKLDFAEEVAKMDAQGIIHSIRNEGDLDEAPGAYKDIEEVMRNQSDLEDILVELSPMAVLKG